MNNELHPPGGEWVGYYTYKDKPARCPMHLTIQFVSERIRGAGIDNPGQFVIEGRYDPSTLQAQWVKRYVAKHSVKYQGEYRNGEIRGSWTLTQNHQGREVWLEGDFCIWPLPADLYSDEDSLQYILAEEIRRKT